MKRIYIGIIAGLLFNIAKAQYPVVTIPGSEVRKITSTIVKGQEYELHVLLPGNYTASTQKYPVVYVMDGQWDFPLVKSIYGQQYYDGFIPAMIVVGVTWGGVNPNPDSLRVRDYTPTNDGKQKQSGGADQFLRVLKEEIFPFIEKNYSADAGNRNLAGCSLGGLFTVYTMLTHTDMFSGYAAASPAVGWDNNILYQYLDQVKVNSFRQNIRLFMTVGDVERSRSTFEQFSAALQAKAINHLAVQAKVLEHTGHSGTKSETYSRGLQFIYEKPVVYLENQQLEAFAGTFTSATGEMIIFRNNNHELLVRMSNGDWIPLNAASGTSFYSNQFFLTLQFDEKGKTVQVNRYNNTLIFTKQ
ncbi:MAG: alpha/beta hydrolase [Bacteroidetes bacterium]|nr:alpha/beta hydrolase [Bacteroidota bacterium]